MHRFSTFSSLDELVLHGNGRIPERRDLVFHGSDETADYGTTIPIRILKGLELRVQEFPFNV
jgi:hypothetical protein